MALLLIVQVFLGGLLGIAAQGFLAWVVIRVLLPAFGLDLLEIARGVAAPNPPGGLIGWLIGPAQ